MFKMLILMLSMIAIGGLWYGGGRLPRLAGTDLDYFLMPFLGYMALMIVSHVAARVVPVKKEA